MICSSAVAVLECRDFIKEAGTEQFSLGFAVSVVDIVDCVPLLKKQIKTVFLLDEWYIEGNFACGPEDPCPIESSQIKGKLSYYNLDF